MANLTNADYVKIQKWIRRDPTAKGQIDGWITDKPTWKATFQAIENYLTDGFLSRPAVSVKAAVEVETGACTNGQAKAVLDAWRYAL